jgi:hypothetical protein
LGLEWILKFNLDLFGFGTALVQNSKLSSTVSAHKSFSRWFQNTILANRACGGGIVAWKGTTLTDAPDNRYGAYIANSEIIRVRVLLMLVAPYSIKAIWAHSHPTRTRRLRRRVYAIWVGGTDNDQTQDTYHHRIYSGRPWNDLATTVWLNTVMDDSIRPAGWTPFSAARSEYSRQEFA